MIRKDFVERKLHLISELGTGEEKRISRLSYKDTFTKLAKFGVYSQDFAEQIAKSAALRSILVHDYDDVDKQILYSSISSCLLDYKDYMEGIQDFFQITK